MVEWTTTPGSMYKQIVVSVFLYSPFSYIGGIFLLYSSKWKSNSKNSHIFAINGKYYTLGITTLSIKLSNFWVRLALDQIGCCDNIPTYMKAHFNSEYAIDFFFTRSETEIILVVLAKNVLYYQNKQFFGKKIGVTF